MTRERLLTAAGVIISVFAVAGVVRRARLDSADPARCGVLVFVGGRCCAQGQSVDRAGTCRGRPSVCPEPLELSRDGRGCVPHGGRVRIPGGTLQVGPMDWEAEGQVSPHVVTVRTFDLDRVEATEEPYEMCVAAGACARIATSGEPGRAVSGLTKAEAAAYCVFRGGRLPEQDEWTWAAAGPRGRRYPWGDTGAVCRRAAWGLDDGPCGYGATGPEIAGAHPAGATPEGVLDMSGNVAEWVNGSDPATDGVRGGGYRSGFAAELRTWHVRAMAPHSRSTDVGVRCAYDIPPEVVAPDADGGTSSK